MNVGLYDKLPVMCIICRLIWMKVSAKCVNVNFGKPALLKLTQTAINQQGKTGNPQWTELVFFVSGVIKELRERS